MGTTSKTMFDFNGKPPHSTATHYLNYTAPRCVHRAGDRIGFVKVVNERVFLLYPDRTHKRSYRLRVIEELGYTLHQLKTLEELMEEYLEK